MEKIIYLVIPCYNEEEVLQETAKRINQEMKALIKRQIISDKSKICFVNDGSVDGTWDIISKLCTINSIFIGINLTRNYGHQNAILAGLIEVHNSCDAVITIDADLQQDINKIEDFINKFYLGNEIVYGVRISRDTDSLTKKLTATCFYSIMNLFGCKILVNHADYRLLSSKAIKKLMEFKEVNLFLRGVIPMLGFKNDIVYFEYSERFAGKSKYTLRKMMSLAINGITSLTIKPIRLITFLGVGFVLTSIIMSIYFFLYNLNNTPSNSNLVILLSLWFIGGVQLISIGIIGEYIGKIYLETKGRPRYIVDEIINSQETNAEGF